MDRITKGRPSEAWAYFNENVTSKDCPALLHPAFRDLPHIQSRSIFNNLLRNMQEEWLAPLKRGSEPTSLPSPLHVLDRFEELGLLTNEMCANVLFQNALALLSAQDKGTDIFIHPIALDAFHESMEIWARSLRWWQNPTEVLAAGGASPYAVDPGTWAKQLSNPDESKDYVVWFGHAVPFFAQKGPNSVAAGAAMMTCYLLGQGKRLESGLPEPFARYLAFLQSLERLLRNTNFDRLERFLVKPYTDAGLGIKKFHAMHQTFEPRASRDPASGGIDEPHNIHEVIQTYNKRLGRAKESQNLDAAEKHWTSVQDLLTPGSGETSIDPAFLPLYEQFLLVFLSLRRPQMASEVWNSMVSNGIEPSVSTWTIMMRGLQITRDFRVQEEMWQRMRDSGLQPDAQAWGTRLFGLFRANRFRDGLRALEEMGREWLTAARHEYAETSNNTRLSAPFDFRSYGDTASGVPKPNTIIMNSCLSALASQGKGYIPQIITFCRNFGIESDVTTYNILINVSLAQDQPQEAIALLQRMTTQGLQPDSATITIILNTLFRSSVFDTLPPDEQQGRIMALIASLESQGVAVDAKGYALLVDRLLKEYNNVTAAHAVLAHMAARNLHPSPHIYTILMTHYFAQDPPDLYAVDALWNQISARSNPGLDVIFYDRMVEGYARHSDVGRMMTFLTRMSKEGKRPGWLAILAVVRRLAESGDMVRLKELVMDIHRREGLLSAGLRGVKGQGDFWQYVMDLGVLDELGITDELDASARKSLAYL